MELTLKNGDYVPNGSGGMEGGEGAQEVLNRVLFRLTARRGGLSFLPGLGSRLYEVLREKPSARLSAARQYVAQALAEEDVTVTDVRLTDTERGTEIAVFLLWKGQELRAQVQAEGG